MKAFAKLALLLTLTCTTIGNITYCTDTDSGGTVTCTRIGSIIRCY